MRKILMIAVAFASFAVTPVSASASQETSTDKVDEHCEQGERLRQEIQLQLEKWREEVRVLSEKEDPDSEYYAASLRLSITNLQMMLPHLEEMLDACPQPAEQ